MTYTVIYDGSAMDHEDTPPIYALDSARRVVKVAGKPVVLTPSKRVFTKMETFRLRGYEFPAGKPVAVSDKSLAKKCLTLGCFRVTESSSDGSETELQPPPAPPRRRGRKRAE